MSNFKSYRDKDGNKVKIGDMVEVCFNLDKEVERIGKVTKITNECFYGITVVLEGEYGHIRAKDTRRLSQK